MSWIYSEKHNDYWISEAIQIWVEEKLDNPSDLPKKYIEFKLSVFKRKRAHCIIIDGSRPVSSIENTSTLKTWNHGFEFWNVSVSV